MAKRKSKNIDEAAKTARDKAEELVSAAAEPVDAALKRAAGGLRKFADIEASGGIALVVAAILALIVSNSVLAGSYQDVFSMKLALKLGPYSFGKSLLHWINDGLMAIFFFVVGLEIKREFLQGELNSLSKLTLPLLAAAGGMIVPAALFVALNYQGGPILEGWAIPMATDIAFALGVLALLGNRVPPALSIFLLSVAIFDDLGAIVVIAMFYAGKISVLAIVSAGLLFAVLIVINLVGVRRPAPYLLVGVLLWFAVLESGVHATIAGVLVALTIPIAEQDGYSPLKSIEDKLHPWSAYLVLPIFAFANAGVPLQGITAEALAGGMTMGIVLGLVVGKPLGVLIACWIALRLKNVKLPEDVSWPMLAGAACLAGIGFTMSLFIGTLAYDAPDFDAQIRLGVLGGSIISGILGFLILKQTIGAKSAG